MPRRLVFLALALCACSTAPKDTANPEPSPPATAPVAGEPTPQVAPIPKGYFTLTPMITVKGVDAAVDFYVRAFAAEKLFAMPGPDGKTTMHAEIKLGDSIVMVEEEMAEGPRAASTLGGSPATLMLYVANADEVFTAAQSAGAKVELPIADQFWGDRYGQLVDPFGHRWAVATHTEDLTPDQMKQRSELLAPPAKAKKGRKPAKHAEPAWKTIAGTPTKTPVPPGYHTVTPAFVAADAAALIDFYEVAFAATERDRMPDGSGKLMHAEVQIGDSIVMLSDENPEQGSKSALTLGGSPVSLMMYDADVDAAFARATTAGAKAVVPLADMFWGDRYGAVLDASGFLWGLATHKEDLTPEQMAERLKAQTSKPAH